MTRDSSASRSGTGRISRVEADPYAPPPLKKDRSGAVLRFVLLAALLAAGAWGFVSLRQGESEFAAAPGVAAPDLIREAPATNPYPSLPEIAYDAGDAPASEPAPTEPPVSESAASEAARDS